MSRYRVGFTLVEAVLAIAVGLMALAGTIYTYQSVRRSADMSNARSTVGTIQTNIAMDKFRLGSPPPAFPSTGVTYSVSGNQDSVGKAYSPNNPTGALPADPIYGVSTVQTYNSSASATPLAAGDASAAWDNPIFASPGGNPSYGKGGWLYDPSTGSFRINLSNHDYPGDLPGNW